MAFKTVDELKEALCEHGLEDAVVFDGSTHYSPAAIGWAISTAGEHVIYDYDKMVKFLVDEGMSSEEAVEWIDYNTLRAIPYMGENAPVVMQSFEAYE